MRPDRGDRGRPDRRRGHAGRSQGQGRRGHRRRGRGVRRRRVGALAEVQTMRGVRSAAVEDRGHAQVTGRARRARRRGHPAGARLPGRRTGRTGRHPRTDARGRLRRAGRQRREPAAAAPGAGPRLVVPPQDAGPLGVQRCAAGAVAAVLRHHRVPHVRHRTWRPGAAVRRDRRQRDGCLVGGEHVRERGGAAGALVRHPGAAGRRTGPAARRAAADHHRDGDRRSLLRWSRPCSGAGSCSGST